jgi:uncharacterized protein YjdB
MRGKRTHVKVRALAPIVVLAASITCAGPAGVDQKPVASVSVQLANTEIQAGASTAAIAVLRDATGTTLHERTTTWSSSNPLVATVVSSTGIVTGVRDGSAIISATAEGITGTAELSVHTPVALVLLSLPASTIHPGDTATASAVTKDARDNVLTGRPISWSSSDAGVATIDASTGKVRAVAEGSATIRATSESVTAETALTVTPVPVGSVSVTLATTQLPMQRVTTAEAIVRNARGETVSDRSVTWSSTDATVALVEETSGVVTAVGVGATRVIATSEGVSGAAELVVTPIPVAAAAVKLAQSVLVAGSTTTAAVALSDANGEALSDRAVAWTSSNPAVAIVDATGVVAAIAPGTADICAISEGVTSQATLQVIPRIASIAVEVAEPSLVAGHTTSASAVARDAAGNVLTGRVIAWSSSNTGVATIDVTGLIAAVAPGITQIIASAEGITSQAPVNVLSPAASITVTLPDSTVRSGSSLTAAATIRDAANHVLTGRPVAWSSSNEAIATVDATTGVVTAVSPGPVTITATSEGIAGQASLTVIAPVRSIAVTLASSSIVSGSATSAAAVVRDAADNVLTGRLLTWSSSNTAVATVDPNTGTVAAVGAGTADIVATSEGVTGQARLAVMPAVNSVSVELGALALLIGRSSTATATVRDASGAIIGERAIAWSSSNPAVAAVDAASGAVTALTPGTAQIIATSEGVSGQATLTVLPAVASVAVTLAASTLIEGQSTTATAESRDETGAALAGRAVTWSSSDPAVATVDDGGTVTAVAKGSAQIIATSVENPAITGQSTLAVAPRVASVEVTLAATPIINGTSTTASAITRDIADSVLTDRPVTWSSDNTAVATVDPVTGAITAVAPGTANILAMSEGISGQAALTVLPVPVVAVTVTLNAPTILIGTATTATAVTRDASGTVLTGRGVTWSSSDPAVAVVDPVTGVVTAVSPGNAEIIATSEGVSGQATLTVPPPVWSVGVTLGASTLVIGQTTAAMATPRDVGGAVLTGRVVAWSSSNRDVATVDATGAVIAVAPGTASIIATTEGISGQATLVVVRPVASVTVALQATLIEGQSTIATSESRDATNVVLTGRSVTWSSSDPAVATVDASGTVTAVGKGAAEIIATSVENPAIAGQSTLAVAPRVSSVSVTLGAASIMLGTPTTASAITRDVADSVLTDRPVTWSSSNPAIATVDPLTGAVTAVAPGTASIVATSEGISGQVTLTVLLVPVASVQVQLAATSIIAGASTTGTAVTRDAANAALAGRAVAWSSSNETVATVDALSGAVMGVGPGSVSIVATSDGVTGQATLTVLPAVASVSVSLAATTLIEGQSTVAGAVSHDATNAILVDRPVTWSSSNPAVATVDASGNVTAAAKGTAQVVATSGENSAISGSALLIVGPRVAAVSVTLSTTSAVAGTAASASASTRDAADSVLTDRPVAWSSSDPAVATVDPVTGAVTAVAPGTATIVATSEGISGQAALTVLPVPVMSVDVQLASAAIIPGASTTASAVTRDANNNALAGRPVAWSSSDPAVATVDPLIGAVTAVAPGSVNIVATSEGISGQAALTVLPVPVALVQVQLGVATIIAGSSTGATADTRDATNNVLTGRVVTWSTSDEVVATVDPVTGVVTALAPGTANIIATSEGVSGQATLTVQPAVASVSVTLAASSLIEGQSTTATAASRDAANAVLTDRPVTWSSDNTAVATVDPVTGAITAVAPGTANIVATSEGISGQAALTVLPVPVATVTVTLNASTILIGTVTTATAVTLDASSNVLTGRTVTWTSSDPGVATVDAVTGAVTALAPGSAAIVATSEGVSGQATLTVPPPVWSVGVTLGASTLVVGQSTAATATPRDVGGAVLSGRVFAWSSSNRDVATVDATGAVTAVAPGTASIIATTEGISGQATLVVVRPVASVSVTLAQPTVVAGTGTTATAELRDALGTVLTGLPVVWSSSNAGVAAVDAVTGAVTTLTPGTANIVATSEGATGQQTLTVLPPVASVAVTLAAATLIEGQSTTATAESRDETGAVLADRPVTWSSSDPAVATVDQAGTVTAVAKGSAEIVATSVENSAITGASVLTVVPRVASVAVTLAATPIINGTSTTASAITRDIADSVLTDRPVTWSSDNTAVATVDPVTGAITAVAPGTANIVATSESITGQATLTVLPVPVASVTVTLSRSPIMIGTTATAIAVMRDAANSVLEGRAVTWSSSDPSIATVDPATGLVTGIAVGSTTITGTSEGIAGGASIEVIPVPVASVAVTLASLEILPGQTTTATAVSLDSIGGALAGRGVTWSSSNDAVATVDPGTGLVTAVAPGSVDIIATSTEDDAITGRGVLTVLVPVASVEVALGASTLPAGQGTTATATSRDAAGAELPDRSVVWSSSDETVAIVDAATGIVTAVAPGTAEIIATSSQNDAITGRATLTVIVPVAAITMALDAVTIIEGGTTLVYGVSRDAAGNELTGRQVVWSTSNETVATVSAGIPTATVTAVGPGTVDIIATAAENGAVSGRIVLTVLPRVASVTVAFPDTTIVPGSTITAVATLQDASLGLISGRLVTWSSSDATVATVDPATGLVSAVARGQVDIIAISEGVEGRAALTVLPPVASVAVTLNASSIYTGTTATATAELRDSTGSILVDRVLAWSSSDPAIATVDPVTGLVTGISAGAVNIVATSEGAIGQAELLVVPAPVTTVSVSFQAPSISAGRSTTPTVVLRDANNNVLSQRVVLWSTSDPAVADVDPVTGLVTGVAQGIATIRATSEGITGEADIGVVARVATVAVTLGASSIYTGTTTQASAELLDDANNVLSGLHITWSSSDPGVATVDAVTGVVSGVTGGIAEIRATSEGVTSHASITVVPAPVASVTISVDPSPVPMNATPTASAVLRDANSNVLTGRAITWGSSNLLVARIDPTTGVVTPVAVGVVTITATSEGVSGQTILGVTEVLDFASDWSTATGTSITAVFENGKWNGVPAVIGGGGPLDALQVVPAAGLDFPSGMANVLKVLFRARPLEYHNVSVNEGWSLPGVGNSLWFRMYFRHDVAGTGDFYHIVQTGPPGECPYNSAWWLNKVGENGMDFQLATLGGASEGATNIHWWGTTGLSRQATYRVEEQYLRVSETDWRLHLRIYDSNNNLIRQDADFRDEATDEPLSTYSGTITTDPACMRNKMVGNPQVEMWGSDDPAHQHMYFGGFAVSRTGWIGPYVPGESRPR